MAVSSEAIN